MDIPVGNSDRCFAVPVFFFIDRAMDIQVVFVGLVVTGATAQKTVEILAVSCSLERQVPAVQDPS